MRHLSLGGGSGVRLAGSVLRLLSAYLCLLSIALLAQSGHDSNIGRDKVCWNTFGWQLCFGGIRGGGFGIRSAGPSPSFLFADAMEEFHVFEPMELHDAAVEKLVKMRKEVGSECTILSSYDHIS